MDHEYKGDLNVLTGKYNLFREMLISRILCYIISVEMDFLHFTAKIPLPKTTKDV